MYWFAASAGRAVRATTSGTWQKRTGQSFETAETGNGMPDYIYLLENRLSPDQQSALKQVREAAREAGTILFLTGDAVRDLTSGHAVRDLEVSVHGDALKLKKIIENLGGKVWGEDEVSRSLYLCFPGTVRLDLISTHRAEYSTPGKPVFHPASIHEDLRRRDFTVNAMAISLNEGSFGLLMDPLNGAADIEARTLRLVSNYGFLEQPSLLIRATRYIARLGWELDPKTLTRYENAKGEGVIEFLSPESRSQELEQIGHEEDGLKVLRALEGEGWMNVLFPAWTSAKADEEKLKALHDLAVELLLQGVHPDMSAGQMQLLTAKMAAKDLAAMKRLMLRPGFVAEWNSLDSMAAGFAKVLLSKANTIPSAGYKLFTTYDPEAILWLGFTSKDAAVRERFDLFLKVWPEARQRIPHVIMQEMRITPELAGYRDIVHGVFLELIDGKLTTPEEIRAYLEPHSPPAPPPQVTIKRPRAKRGEAKVKEAAFEDDDEDAEESGDEDDDLDLGGDDDEIDLGLSLPKVDLDSELSDDADLEVDSEPEADGGDVDEDEDEPPPTPTKRNAKPAAATNALKEAPVLAALKAEPAVSGAKASITPQKAAPSAGTTIAKTVPAKLPAPVAKKAAPAPIATKGGKVQRPAAATAGKTIAKAPAKPAGKAPAKAPVKVAAKVLVKVAAKSPAKGPAAKSASAKGKPAPGSASKASKASHGGKASKPAVKKPAPKPAKKR
jgi:tRNA nucleotidyltransferase/poly(A) polymerase